MEMVMKLQGECLQGHEGEGKCLRTVQAADRPDAGSGRPRPGGRVSRMPGCWFFCQVSSSSSPFLSKARISLFKTSYLLTWVAVKQMFTLKLSLNSKDTFGAHVYMCVYWT